VHGFSAFFDGIPPIGAQASTRWQRFGENQHPDTLFSLCEISSCDFGPTSILHAFVIDNGTHVIQRQLWLHYTSATMGDSTLSTVSSLLQSLATNTHIAPTSYQNHQLVKLPGVDTPAKLALERDIAALIARVQCLETKAISVNNQTLPDTPNETGAPSAFADVLTGGPGRAATKNHPTKKSSNSSLLSGRESATGERPQKLPRLSNDELIETLQQQIDDQAKQIQSGKEKQDAIQAQMLKQAQQQEKAINQYEVERVASLERELKKHQQANEAFQKALREIGEIITAVARGDLSKKVQIHSVEMDPEITTFKRVSNVSHSPLFFANVFQGD